MDYLSHFFVWALTLFGVTNAFKVAALLQPLREFLQFKEVHKRNEHGMPVEATARKNQFFYKLITCPMCLGWWLGGLMGLLVWSPTGSDVFIITRLISDAFLGSISSWLLYIFINDRQFSVK